MKRLQRYFTDGISSRTLETVGAEVETQFVDAGGSPITTEMSQRMLAALADNGWAVECRKGSLVTCLVDPDGNRLFYELGRHNIEVATRALKPDTVLGVAQSCLDQLYRAAADEGARPWLAPILPGREDLLVIPDERDAVWLELDGREALAPLARTSSVQFTVSVSPEEAVRVLNALGKNIDAFLDDFPQDAVWKKYIKESRAGYSPSRYGGPLSYSSLDDYCVALSLRSVVQGTTLVTLPDVEDLDIPLFIRSVWWHFRLKRYGNSLCVEVRPMARWSDHRLHSQLRRVLDIIDA